MLNRHEDQDDLFAVRTPVAGGRTLFSLLLAVAVLALSPAAGPAQPADGAPSARALADSLEEGVTGAALRGDRACLEELERLAARARDRYPEDPWIRHHHGYALYRLALTRMADAGPSAADSLLARTQEVLAVSARRDSVPESFALLSTVLGIRISANPAERARSMGLRSRQAMRAARATGPENPRVWLIRAINASHAPERFGGGPEETGRFLERALALLEEEEPDPGAPGWGRAETHAYLGRVRARKGRPEAAREHYREALAVEPGYRWVEEELLPALGEDGRGGG